MAQNIIIMTFFLYNFFNLCVCKVFNQSSMFIYIFLTIHIVKIKYEIRINFFTFSVKCLGFLNKNEKHIFTTDTL